MYKTTYFVFAPPVHTIASKNLDNILKIKITFILTCHKPENMMCKKCS